LPVTAKLERALKEVGVELVSNLTVSDAVEKLKALYLNGGDKL
jgi:hypothetical protein